MSKYYSTKIESNKDFYVYFGSRRSGKSYYEFKKLQENYNILKNTNDGLIYTKNCLESEVKCLKQRIDKAIEYIKEECFSEEYGFTNYGGSLIPKCIVSILQGGEDNE